MINQATPMHSHEAEQSVIGGLMLCCQSGDAKRIAAVTSLVKSASFYSAPHRIIYEQIIHMLTTGKSVDLLTLSQRISAIGEDDRSGGIAYLAEVIKNTPSAANVVPYAKIVRDHAVRRFAMTKLNDAMELLATSGHETVTEQITAIHGVLAAVNDYAATGERRGLRHVREIANEWIDELELRQSGASRKVGFTFGIPTLDAMIEPKNIPAGSLVVVGARPKMGKSSFMIRTIAHFTRNHGGAAVFSLEMPDDQIWERFVSQESRVSSNKFYTGMDSNEWGALSNAMGVSLDSHLYIDDTPGASLSHIQSEVRKLRADGVNVGLVAVDYLTLMQAEKAERNDLAYGVVTKGLKNLAKEINGVVLLLTQLNRNLESRTDKRPLPSDSRDTGQIEQDCDMWIGLYRDEVYHEDSPYAGTIEMLLRLNRHGSTGTAVAGFINGHIVDIDEAVVEVMRENAAANAEAKQKSYKKGGFND